MSENETQATVSENKAEAPTRAERRTGAARASEPKPAKAPKPKAAPNAKAANDPVRVRVTHGIYWLSNDTQHPVGSVVLVEAAEAKRLLEAGDVELVAEGDQEIEDFADAAAADEVDPSAPKDN